MPDFLKSIQKINQNVGNSAKIKYIQS